VSRIESALGILSERFAFCQTMPLDDFLTAALSLRKSGYRPVRFRPYGDGRNLQVAAVWTRDGRPWRISSGLTADQVRQHDVRHKQDKFIPVDVAGYVTTDAAGKPADRYAGVWVDNSADLGTWLYVGITADEEGEVHNKLKDEKLIPRTLHAMIGVDGRARYCGVWGRPPGTAVTGQTFGKMDQDADLDPIRDDPAFAEIMNAGHSDRRIATVWTSDAGYEAIPVYGVDPAAHDKKCRELVAQGYRPASWSVTRTTPDAPLTTASVWHRPLVTEETKDRLAERQPRAAIALVRMGKAEEVWPLLRHSADPRLRSFIVNWLNPLGADPKLIAWYQANSKVRAWTCGSLFPNDLGLFDMLGNVNEWCQDRGDAYGKTKKGLKYDTVHRASYISPHSGRVRRGGCYLYPSDIIRSAERSGYTPELHIVYLGFRPARTYP